MKTFACHLILTASLIFSLTPSSLQAENLPPPTEYRLVDQGAHHDVWQRETFEQAPDGKIVPKIHQYTELATGLNYQDAQGNWQASKETITIQPDGTAIAVHGQHKAYFPADIYNGMIKLVTPDGQVMQSQPAVLSYSDGNNTALIAVLTNSIGYLAASNQVIYPNAFAGINADLRYTYTKAGFEQDVILHEQPPLPAALGLNPETTKIQVLTEFLSAPTPQITTRKFSAKAKAEVDEDLAFGSMAMVPGKAFSLGREAKLAKVRKNWVKLQGRQFLLEEVPTTEVAEDLEALPVPDQQTRTGRPVPVLAKELVLPPSHLAQQSPSPSKIQLAATGRPASGLVLDYNTVNSSLTNYTFQGDQTYYVSGPVDLYGTNTTFEGGTVLKYPTNITIELTVHSGGILCKTRAYSPAVFTSKNDNSVGQPISGSSGNPAMGLATYLTIGADSITNLHDLRFAYAETAVNSFGVTENVRNSVFLKCAYGVAIIYNDLSLYNVLFAGCSYAVYSAYSGTITEENVTTDGTSMSGFATTLCLTNCIFTVDYGSGTTLNASHNIMSYDPHYDGFNVVSLPYFAASGGGHYYLTNNSACRGLGTTNIDPTLLADLSAKTTYPPIGYSNLTFSTAMTFSPQAQRDNGAQLDPGYHYDPLDYLFVNSSASNNVTFTTGTAAAWTTSEGLHLTAPVTATFNGNATYPNYWVRANTVQEQDGDGNYGAGGMVSWYSSTPAGAPLIQGTFLRCSMLAGYGNAFRDDFYCLNLILNHSEFWTTGEGGYIISLYLTNCLFERTYVAQDSGLSGNQFVLRNCTSHGGLIYLTTSGATADVQNCAFDGTTFTLSGNALSTSYSTYAYNAYTNASNPFTIGGSHDLSGITSFNWQSSWFGNYYLPTNSTLINAGNTTADVEGLYHFTTQTNQVKETNSVVDIGYHYVATDAYGIPIDTNGDGIPDYLEDVNGNGLVDTGEIGWNINGDLGLQIIISQPRNGSIIP